MPICPNCGKELPGEFPFCPFCAAPLTQGPRAEGAKERKTVSVLFCDIVGFTAASESADPEEVQARVAPYHARVRERIEAFGGTVEKFIGDAVMAVFGAPAAHEDDAERAVRAGLAILDGLADLNERSQGLALAVRIGINTGEALVTLDASPESGEGMVTGDVVNTAARIQSQAPVDGVGVGRGTYLATRRVFDYEPLEPITAKGKSAPVEVWRAVASRARLGTDVIRSMLTPLVGRDLDLALLRGTFDKVKAEQEVQLVSVVGEPGVGKSRLVAELAGYVDQLPMLVRWRQGRCLPYGEGITFWALGEIVKAQAGILESDPPAEAQAKLEAALPAGDELPWLRARLLPLIGIDPGIAAPREESFAAWRRFLESIAEDGPLVLVVEDIHWADASMLDFIEHMADWAQGVPLLIVCTARPELYERRPAWGSGLRNAATIRLSPLSDADTAALVSALLDRTELPSETQRVLLARAGGNPLYAEEFVRMLRDRDLLDPDGRLRPGVDVDFPASLQALIAARLDTLPSDRKSLLQDAAVIGKVFWSGAVAAMGARLPTDVEVALHELGRKELVRPFRRSSMAGEQELGFWHVIVRDVAYGQVPRAQRAAKHVTAVAWLEGKAGDRVEDVAEVLAYHTGEAMTLAQATGDAALAARLAPAARRYALLAGERALGLDLGTAVAHFERALAITPEEDSDHAHVLLRYADALAQVARYRESIAAAEGALESFLAAGDTEAAAEAMGVIGLAKSRIGDQAGALGVVTRAVALLETVAPGPALVATLAQLAAALLVNARLHEAITAADRAIAVSAELRLPVPGRALAYRGAARGMLGDRDGFAEMERAIELLVGAGASSFAATAMHNLGVGIWELDGPTAAVQRMTAARVFAEERGIGIALATSVIESAMLSAAGRPREGLAMAERIRDRVAATGQVQTLVRIDALRARTHHGAGREEESRAAAAAALAEATELGDDRSLVLGLAPAITAGVIGDEDARLLIERLVVAPDRPVDHDYVAALPALIPHAARLGGLDLARRLAQGIEPTNPLFVHSRDQIAAELAEAEGDFARAADLHAVAVDGWRSFGSPLWVALSLLAQGRCLVRAGDPAAAAAPLREARAMHAEMGAVLYVAAGDALLAESDEDRQGR